MKLRIITLDYLILLMNNHITEDDLLNYPEGQICQQYISQKVSQISSKLNLTLDTKSQSLSSNYCARYLDDISSDKILLIFQSFRNSLRLFLGSFIIDKEITAESEQV